MLAEAKLWRTAIWALLILIWAASGTSLEGQDSGKGVKVVYTGNLFGYFRLPDQQTKADDHCPIGTEIDARANNEAKTFFGILPQQRKGLLLLGMGENFSPELHSRTITDGTQKESRDRYYWDFVDGTRYYMDEEKLQPPSYNHLMAEMTRGIGRIPIDNVACFLSHAGYTAVVPGKHDFYFGPEYLRYLARLLASPADTADYSPVQMLGANLVIETTVQGAAKRIPYRDKTALKYSDDPGNIKFNLEDGASVLPWIQRVIATITTGEKKEEKSPRFWICPVRSGSHDPDDADVPNTDEPRKSSCAELVASTGQDRGTDPEKGLGYDLPQGPTNRSVAYTYLTPGKSYLLCATDVARKLADRKHRPYCQHLNVHAPFFNYPFAVLAPGQNWERVANELDQPLQGGVAYKPEFKNPAPYVVKEFPNEAGTQPTEVAIFGAVDQELTEHVGKLNYSWVNLETDKTDQLQEHDSLTTEVKVIDPVEALRQQLEYFEKDRPAFAGFKILLAQMPAYKARELAAAMAGKFNLIIAQAEFEDATRPGTISIKVPQRSATQGREARASGSGLPTFIAVPEPFYANREGGNLRLQVRSATMKITPCTAPCSRQENTWSMDTTFVRPADSTHLLPYTDSEAFVPGGQPDVQIFCDPEMMRVVHNTLRNVSYDANEGEKINPKPTPTPDPSCKVNQAFSKFKQLALVVMQTEVHADMAILQQRDFFQTQVQTGVKLQPENLQEILDRIFWKGDFLLKIHVRGDVLKKIMQRSKQFDADDKASLSLYHEIGRGLVTLGIFQDRVNSTFIVNGDAVDDNKVYTIATSDYMGLGDTGYSDLLSAPIGKPLAPSDVHSIDYISTLVCREMRAASEWTKSGVCHSSVDAEQYFAGLEQFPFDATSGFTPLRHLLSWAKFQKRRPGLYSSNNITPLEQSFQQRPIWGLSLSKLALGFTMNQHNHGTESNLANLFGGITSVPMVSAANSSTTTLDASLRLQRSSQHLEIFEQNDATYTRQLTRQNDANNTDLATQPKNQMSFESGVLLRLFPHTKEIPGLKELVSARVETQVADPLTNFKLAAGGVLPFVGDRTQTLLGKYGLRFDNQKSWIEAGYQAGELISSPAQFVFNPSTPFAVTCSATNAKQPPQTPQTPQSQLPLATCVKNNSKAGGPITASSRVAEVTRNHFVHGLFLNFKMNMPLPGNDKLTYVMENKGQLFFNRGNDVSVETRLVEDWTHSLIVPLFGNLSFVPKVELIAFQNKVDHNFFWTYQPSLTLQYSLDWHNGLSWRRALQYQNPQVSAKSAQ